MQRHGRSVSWGPAARTAARGALRRRLMLAAPAALALLAARGAAAAAGSQRTVLVMGDSLSAEFGLPRGSGWVRLLADRLAAKAPAWQVENASISGETTSGGRARLERLLAEHRPEVVVIELGANDGLRGLALHAMEDNLRAMVAASQAHGAGVVLVGMRLPPNYGPAYEKGFHEVFETVASATRVALVPFLMEGFAQDLGRFQADRIHPAVPAQALMLDNVWPVLERVLRARR